jgi:quinol-cytochrome oxidoreductase complex cytochrome b subunit
MKFKEPTRRNPFDHPLVTITMHLCALAIAVVAVWGALAHHSLTPLWIGLVVLTILEGTWLYFTLRR